jgi:hypothetical protein
MTNIKNRKDTTDAFQAIDSKQLVSTTGGAWNWGGTSNWNSNASASATASPSWNKSWAPTWSR